MFFQQQQAIDDKKLLPKAQNNPFHSGDNSSTVEVRFEENHQTSYSKTYKQKMKTTLAIQRPDVRGILS